MFIGIALFSYTTGYVLTELSSLTLNRRRGLMKIRVKNHIIFCNFYSVDKVFALMEEVRSIPIFADKSIVIIDPDLKELPNEFKHKEVSFVRGYPTDRTVLEKANLVHAIGVLILGIRGLNSSSDALVFSVSSVVKRILSERKRKRRVKVIVETFTQTGYQLFSNGAVDGMVSVHGVHTCMLAQELKHPGICGVFFGGIDEQIWE